MEHLLKSCYICGGISEIVNKSESSIWVIKCRNPRCSVHPNMCGQDLKKLLREWNSKNSGKI